LGKNGRERAENGGVEEVRSIKIPRGSHFTEPGARGASDPSGAGKVRSGESLCICRKRPQRMHI
jgi:hypothetical protein